MVEKCCSKACWLKSRIVFDGGYGGDGDENREREIEGECGRETKARVRSCLTKCDTSTSLAMACMLFKHVVHVCVSLKLDLFSFFLFFFFAYYSSTYTHASSAVFFALTKSNPFTVKWTLTGCSKEYHKRWQWKEIHVASWYIGLHLIFVREK